MTATKTKKAKKAVEPITKRALTHEIQVEMAREYAAAVIAVAECEGQTTEEVLMRIEHLPLSDRWMDFCRHQLSEQVSNLIDEMYKREGEKEG